MSDPKHTPGPWTAGIWYPTKTMQERIKHPQAAVLLNHDPSKPEEMLVALCGDADDYASLWDSRLISAAPDLLEAGRNVISAVDAIDPVRLDAALANLKSAIRKAQGEDK